MTSRERMIAALSHREADRVPILEEIWSTTKDRWVREGMPADVSFERYFGIDEYVVISADCSFRLPEETIEETDEFVVRRDANGSHVKTWKHATSTPEIVATSIDSPAAWQEMKHRLEFTADRVDWDAVVPLYGEARRRDQFVHFGAQFAYERWASIVGTEQYLMALVAEPEWVREMHEADVRLALAAYEELTGRGMQFDAMRFSCDMGYRNGLLFSPQVYRELFAPGLKRLCDFFHDRGMFNVLHSCGDVTTLVPDIIATGFDCLNPIEVKAGMDLARLKKQYGDQLCLMGGIDARKMSADPEVIEEEIRTKLTAAKRRGGYIFHSDHTVPDDVSLEQYRNVVRLAFRYGGYTKIDDSA